MRGMSEPTPSSTSPEVAFSLATPYRDVTCGELRAGDAGREVRMAGWVHRRRDHGNLIFLDLRDRYGITQVVINEAVTPQAASVAVRVRNEFVLEIRGAVAHRLAGMENAKLATGEIEVQAQSVEILSEAETPPFYINEPDAPVDESLRLKYRYLDIRRRPMLERLMLRSELVHAIREAHYRAGFVEVETPILLKSTPEGARDFIVPSRLQPGTVYALPQSPQQLKQLLMVAGMDRYFQIARCFRDEDLRGDRQLEFTQLDLEMSFVTEQRVMDFVEAMIVEVSRKVVPDRPIQQTAVSPYRLPRGARTFRLRQARPSVRHGAGGSRAGAGGGEHRLPRLRRCARRRRARQGDRGPGDGRCQPLTDRRADGVRAALRRQGPGPHLPWRRRHGPLADREVPGRGADRGGGLRPPRPGRAT